MHATLICGEWFTWLEGLLERGLGHYMHFIIMFDHMTNRCVMGFILKTTFKSIWAICLSVNKWCSSLGSTDDDAVNGSMMKSALTNSSVPDGVSSLLCFCDLYGSGLTSSLLNGQAGAGVTMFTLTGILFDYDSFQWCSALRSLKFGHDSFLILIQFYHFFYDS